MAAKTALLIVASFIFGCASIPSSDPFEHEIFESMKESEKDGNPVLLPFLAGQQVKRAEYEGGISYHSGAGPNSFERFRDLCEKNRYSFESSVATLFRYGNCRDERQNLIFFVRNGPTCALRNEKCVFRSIDVLLASANKQAEFKSLARKIGYEDQYDTAEELAAEENSRQESSRKDYQSRVQHAKEREAQKQEIQYIRTKGSKVCRADSKTRTEAYVDDVGEAGENIKVQLPDGRFAWEKASAWSRCE